MEVLIFYLNITELVNAANRALQIELITHVCNVAI